MDAIEIIKTVVVIAGGITAVWGACKAITAFVKWLRSWKLIKRTDFETLKKIEGEHQKCEAEKERLRKLDNPMARKIHSYLENPPKEPEVDSEFNVLEPFKNRR